MKVLQKSFKDAKVFAFMESTTPIGQESGRGPRESNVPKLGVQEVTKQVTKGFLLSVAEPSTMEFVKQVAESFTNDLRNTQGWRNHLSSRDKKNS